MQFVALNDIIDSPQDEIARQLLDEIPRQLVEYMQLKGIQPTDYGRKRSSTSDIKVIPIESLSKFNPEEA